MVNILRRWSQPLMVVIAVLVIVSFAFWGPQGFMETKGGRVAFEVYGKKITVEEQDRISNRLRVYGGLGGGYFNGIQSTSHMPLQFDPTRDEFDSPFINSVVFEHEADAMGIAVTEKEIQEELLKIPAFQGFGPGGRPSGAFDVAAVDFFIQRVLQPNGFSKDNLDSFLAGEVRMRKVQELLKSSVAITPEEVRNTLLERNQVTEASFVEFKKTDFLAAIVVPEEETKKRYEERKDQLKTDELRKVKYVAFQVPPPADPAKPPTETDRVKQLQLAVNAAYDFSQAIKKGGKFEELAAAQTAEAEKNKSNFVFSTGQTESFAKSDVPEILEGNENEVADKVGDAVFDLKKESPISQHIIGKKAAYVLMLPEGGITEPKPKTFEECRGDLASQIQNEKADEAMRKKAEEVQKKIVEAKKAGKSFTEACEAAGVKAEAYPAYSMMKRPPQPSNNQVPAVATKLAPGDVSEFTPGGAGGIIVHLDQRPVIDEKTFEEQKAGHIANEEQERMRSIFRDWLKERRRAAGLESTAGNAANAANPQG